MRAALLAVVLGLASLAAFATPVAPAVALALRRFTGGRRLQRDVSERQLQWRAGGQQLLREFIARLNTSPEFAAFSRFVISATCDINPPTLHRMRIAAWPMAVHRAFCEGYPWPPRFPRRLRIHP